MTLIPEVQQHGGNSGGTIIPDGHGWNPQSGCSMGERLFGITCHPGVATENVFSRDLALWEFMWDSG